MKVDFREDINFYFWCGVKQNNTMNRPPLSQIIKITLCAGGASGVIQHQKRKCSEVAKEIFGL